MDTWMLLLCKFEQFCNCNFFLASLIIINISSYSVSIFIGVLNVLYFEHRLVFPEIFNFS